MRCHPKRVLVLGALVLGAIYLVQQYKPAPAPRPHYAGVKHGKADGDVAPRAAAVQQQRDAVPDEQVEEPAPAPPPASTRRDKYLNYAFTLTPPKDYRAQECKAELTRLQALPKDALPTCSVVLAFCNEPTKSLYHTIYSVIERSPPHLLYEVSNEVPVSVPVCVCVCVCRARHTCCTRYATRCRCRCRCLCLCVCVCVPRPCLRIVSHASLRLGRSGKQTSRRTHGIPQPGLHANVCCPCPCQEAYLGVCPVCRSSVGHNAVVVQLPVRPGRARTLTPACYTRTPPLGARP